MFSKDFLRGIEQALTNDPIGVQKRHAIQSAQEQGNTVAAWQTMDEGDVKNPYDRATGFFK